MPFVVFAAPLSPLKFYFHLPAHCNFPAVHSVISLLSCNASWNTTGYGVWSWWWGKQILHHHMELLLLCRPFYLLYCRCYNIYACLLLVALYLHSLVIVEVTPCSAWVQIAIILMSKDLFIIVFIPNLEVPISVPHLSLFFISVLLFIHVQQENTISPSLLFTQVYAKMKT